LAQVFCPWLAMPKGSDDFGSPDRRGDDPTYEKLLETPRTKEAMRKLGITSDEVQVKQFQDFYVAGDMVDKQRLRFNHYESKRRERMHNIMSERAKIIAKNANGGGSSKSFGSLAVMEQLLDKEARRLEKDLRAQLRFHAAVEKDNEEQLDREASLREKERFREDTREKRRKMLEAAANQIKTVVEAKHDRANSNQEALDQDHMNKQAQYMQEMLEEEMRLQEWEEAKARSRSDKSEVWRLKMEQQQQHRETLDVQRELDAQEQMNKYRSKIDQLEQRRQLEDRQRQLRCEEQQLRLLDAKSKATQIERQQLTRRQEIAERLEEANDRIETLLHLKDQILEQRKKRIRHNAAIKAKPVNIRRITPGPAQYAAQPSSVLDAKASKISTSNVVSFQPGSIDSMVRNAKQVPAAGTYDAKTLPNGDYVGAGHGGLKIGKGQKINFLDIEQRTRSFCPGPGSYETKSTVVLPNGVKMVRDYIPSKQKKAGDDLPAPNHYAVDDYHRKTRLQKLQKSLPALMKALTVSDTLKVA